MAQMKRGQGTVFQDKTTKKWIWQGSYIDEKGKKKRPKKTFDTEKEALKFQAEQLDKKEVEKKKKEKGYKVKEVYNEFLEEVAKGKIKYSINTMRCTEGNFNKHILPIFADKKIKDIKKESLERFFKSLEDSISDKTIKNVYDDFKKLYKYAEDKKYISNNVLKELDIKAKKNKKIVNTITESEYQTLLNCEKNKKMYHYPIIWLLGETGLRAEELAFNGTDIKSYENEVGRYVEINKSIVRVKGKGLQIVFEVKTEGSDRKVPLSNEAEFALMEWYSRTGRSETTRGTLFIAKNGSLIDYRNILRSYHIMLENAGLEKRGLHSLRKRFIKHSHTAGVSDMDIAKILGHSFATMYNSYYNLDDEMLSEIAKKIEKNKKSYE